MVLVGALIILVLNECSSGEGWFRGLALSLCGAAGLIWAATVSPARTFVIGLMVLCAVVAVELDRISRRRSEAAKTLRMLDDKDMDRNARNARRDMRITRRKDTRKAA
ncbi:hypothetical protein [Ruminococcus sp.]|uniref:hypothetical protein n=1 Tax=Ruminococcus sp. TaxID=41978 RepID=UPI0025E2E7C5|nr:hypothetical protein [Ruminococcus sp.]MBQ8966751.1 hypothetical protein [Ruminococcus sp.]